MPPPYISRYAPMTPANSTLPSSTTLPALSTQSTTPPQLHIEDATVRTPRGRASASERDAIETLLFMSSPGNSQNFRRPIETSLPKGLSVIRAGVEPLRRNISSDPGGRPESARKAMFSPLKTATAIKAADKKPLSPQPTHMFDHMDLGNDDSIDMFLDQMPSRGHDNDSSSDESTGSVNRAREITPGVVL